MTKDSEALLRGILSAVAICLVLGSIGLSTRMIVYPPAAPKLSIGTPDRNLPITNQSAEQPDPKITRLSNARMSRSVVEHIEVQQKPPAPDLSLLIRVKGIMDFGNPKTNEAIVENIRTTQTASYKSGDSIPDIGATVVQISDSVSFNYDGRIVKLGVASGENANSGSTAGQGAPAFSAEIHR